MKPILFLHIPKTAGQTIHNEICRVIGAENASPIRVHTQVKRETQYPAGFRFYSGHLDWNDFGTVPKDRFVFTVLRDPKERIASFYLYMRAKAEKLSAEELAQPGLAGQRAILEKSADDYFFEGDEKYQLFIHDHYDNFYCTYFATQKMRGWLDIKALQKQDLIEKALAGTKLIDEIYGLGDLARLEKDLFDILGQPVNIVETRHNAGPQNDHSARWPKLLSLLERDKSADLLDRFTRYDTALLQQLGLDETIR